MSYFQPSEYFIKPTYLLAAAYLAKQAYMFESDTKTPLACRALTNLNRLAESRREWQDLVWHTIADVAGAYAPQSATRSRIMGAVIRSLMLILDAELEDTRDDATYTSTDWLDDESVLRLLRELGCTSADEHPRHVIPQDREARLDRFLAFPYDPLALVSLKFLSVEDFYGVKRGPYAAPERTYDLKAVAAELTAADPALVTFQPLKMR